MSEMMGWHSLAAGGKTANGEGIKVEVGQTLEWRGKVSLCSSGYHASARAIDMLKHIAGPIVCRVKLHGEIIESDDKAVASHRTCIAMLDATRILQEFAIWCAEEALSLIPADKTDVRSVNALKVTRAYFAGQATRDELAAARETVADAYADAAAARETAADAYADAAADAYADAAAAAARETAAAAYAAAAAAAAAADAAAYVAAADAYAAAYVAAYVAAAYADAAAAATADAYAAAAATAYVAYAAYGAGVAAAADDKQNAKLEAMLTEAMGIKDE